jgi:hypothetical protein
MRRVGKNRGNRNLINATERNGPVKTGGCRLSVKKICQRDDLSSVQPGSVSDEIIPPVQIAIPFLAPVPQRLF